MAGVVRLGAPLKTLAEDKALLDAFIFNSIQFWSGGKWQDVPSADKASTAAVETPTQESADANP